MGKRKSSKVKEPVTLRTKKLSDGSESLYLDIYVDGSRSYKFLKLYLLPGNNVEIKGRNRETLRMANAIKSKVIIDIANGTAGVGKAHDRSRMLLADWMETYARRKKENGQSASNYLQLCNLRRHLIIYAGDKVTMKDVDKSFCKGFIRYLQSAQTKDGRAFAQSTISRYFVHLSSVLRAAVRAEVLSKNPIELMETEDKPAAAETERPYLTIGELRTLAATPCRHDEVRRAFMFSCFTGLRLGDIERLTWGDFTRDGKQWRLELRMGKTRRVLCLPVPDAAMKFLPGGDGAADDARVFRMPTRSWVHSILRKWAADAGLKKSVSFHTARHSYATTALTLGADLYTVSKLLGHSRTSTTEVYAKIIDKRKDEAARLLDNLLTDD